MANSVVTQKICSVDGCDGKTVGKGLCTKHYQRHKKNSAPECKIDGCDKRSTANNGLCGAHNRRLKLYGDPLAGKNMRGEALRHFKTYMNLPPTDECFLWPYSTAGRGYGVIIIDGAPIYVHRFALMTFEGIEDPGEKIHCRHKCGNGHIGCFNPRHLMWGTALDNAQDTVLHGKTTRGRKNPQCKLTEEQVRFIRSSSVSNTDLSRRFGVTDSNINCIKTGKSWAWLED